ncbi:MAG TPA: DUF6569 family protein [Planctomycetota bacterium]|nr:DUF6569 family protein [Planctomycetota bacterium]
MRRALAALLVLLAACSDAPSPAPSGETVREVDSPPPADLEGYRFSAPAEHGNLSVILLLKKGVPQGDLGCLTLEDALKSGAVRITEKSDGAEVNALEVENAGDRPVYLQAGDAVKGGQQDRTIAVDFILPARSGKRGVEAFCVEPGRWSVRSPQAGALTGATFALAEAPLATNEQKLAVRLEKSQNKVWAAGEKVNRDLVSPQGSGGQPLTGAALTLEEPKNSYVEAAEDPAVQKKLLDRLKALEGAPADQAEAVGAAFCVNGKIQTVEIYSNAGLFRKLWPKLLRSAALQALSMESESESTRTPAETELRALLRYVAGQKGKAELRTGNQLVRVFEREHAVLFDTEADGKLLHRQLITR